MEALLLGLLLAVVAAGIAFWIKGSKKSLLLPKPTATPTAQKIPEPVVAKVEAPVGPTWAQRLSNGL